jgi:hypothetical protein
MTVSKTVLATFAKSWPNSLVRLALICVDIVVPAPQQTMQIGLNNPTTVRLFLKTQELLLDLQVEYFDHIGAAFHHETPA